MNHIISVCDSERDLFTSPLKQVCSSGNMPPDLHAGKLTVDWSRASFASISQIAAVTQAQLGCSKRSGLPALNEGVSCKISGYISRMNYYGIVGLLHSEDFARHDPSGKFMPMERICADKNSNDIPNVLRDVVLDRISASENVKDMVSLAFGEVIDNVIHHSESPCGGIACAQFYPQAASVPYIEYCVTDSGKGIAASMAENSSYAGLSPSKLVAKAFERKTGQWYGRVPDGTSRVSGGVGLSISAGLAAALDGVIWCVSHDSAVEIRNGKTAMVDGLYYPGTIIVVRLPVTDDAVVNESDLFDGGAPRPVRWNPQDGRYYDGESDWELW